MRALHASLGVMLVAVVVTASACGGSSNTSGFGESSSGGDGGAGGAGGGGGGGFGGSNGPASGEGGAGSTSDGGCFAPVDMYIMMDRSGSMGASCKIGGTTNSKWCHSVNALSGYFNSAGSMDQAAAIQFFPLNTQTNALCSTGDQYNVPAFPSTDYQALPSNAFDSLLNSTGPGGGGFGGFGGGGGGTPTEAGIRGLIRFTEGNRRPGHVTIGVLITDGDPNGCDQNLMDLSALLQTHYMTSTIRTYVIGMQGATFDNLEQIAQGGNAPQHPNVVGAVTNACGNGAASCRTWNVGDGDPTVFNAALAAIQQSANGCNAGGGTVNPPK